MVIYILFMIIILYRFFTLYNCDLSNTRIASAAYAACAGYLAIFAYRPAWLGAQRCRLETILCSEMSMIAFLFVVLYH